MKSELKLNWLDHNLWTTLARKQGNRLTNNNFPATPKTVRRILKKLNLKTPDFKEWCGLSVQDFIKRNPTIPAFAIHGQLLEMLYEQEIMAGTVNEDA